MASSINTPLLSDSAFRNNKAEAKYATAGTVESLGDAASNYLSVKNIERLVANIGTRDNARNFESSLLEMRLRQRGISFEKGWTATSSLAQTKNSFGLQCPSVQKTTLEKTATDWKLSCLQKVELDMVLSHRKRCRKASTHLTKGLNPRSSSLCGESSSQFDTERQFDDSTIKTGMMAILDWMPPSATKKRWR